MDSFAQSLLGFINKNQSEYLIIDLRDNYGGDFFVGLKLAQWLVLADTINWKSGVYTLIDNLTFSKRLYHFKEGQRDALYPDVHVEVSIEDHMKGYDRPLRWVLSDIGDTNGALVNSFD